MGISLVYGTLPCTLSGTVLSSNGCSGCNRVHHLTSISTRFLAYQDVDGLLNSIPPNMGGKLSLIYFLPELLRLLPIAHRGSFSTVMPLSAYTVVSDAPKDKVNAAHHVSALHSQSTSRPTPDARAATVRMARIRHPVLGLQGPRSHVTGA